MKKHIFKKSFVAAGMLLVTAMSYGQSSASGYFVEGFNQRYQLNPAFAPERSVFVAIPAFSNIQMEATSNVGISNFVFDTGDEKLHTFMSPKVSSSDFLDKMPSTTQFSLNLSMDLFGFGFGGKNWFTSFNVKVRNNEEILMPKSLFKFMKNSLSEGRYIMEDINVNTYTYAEVGLTHSQKIGDNLTVGLGLKALAGLWYADVNIDRIDANLTGDSWKVNTAATANVAVPGLEYKYRIDEESGRRILDGTEKYEFEASNVVPSSYGFAVDLGAEYDFKDLVEGLKVSASLTDLGFINWEGMYTFATDKDKYVEFNGFNDYDVNENAKEDDTMDKLKDDFEDMIQFHPEKEDGSKKVSLNATFRLGAEYNVPGLEWLSVGELFTYRGGSLPYTSSRTSVTLTPCGWFDFTGSYAFTSLGSTFGLLFNLHPAGLNLFVAVDRIKADFNRQFVPVNDFGLNYSIGLNLAVGGKRK
jgi:hypothetical protein